MKPIPATPHPTLRPLRPTAALVLAAGLSLNWVAAAADGSLKAQFDHAERQPGNSAIEWVQSIKADAPMDRSEMGGGHMSILFHAPGMTHARASCWQQPTPEKPSRGGHDEVVAPDIRIGPDGRGSFLFPAHEFPNGPLNIRIQAKDDGRKQDLYQFQLFNLDGVVWNQGIPKNDPPAPPLRVSSAGGSLRRGTRRWRRPR